MYNTNSPMPSVVPTCVSSCVPFKKNSPDYASTVDYLETVAALPWSKRSDGLIDLTAAEEVLNSDHYGLEKVKRRLLEYLAVRKLSGFNDGPHHDGT